ncbi:universal stress protein [Fictibacillus sp. WQ 8-8]|uniref:universal stress protein n=1 Tax=unclassified Fictibacillus TaxID=2644029 RepID=UPI00210F0A91|nr:MULTISPECIES: universal stress protein [unclassified Fictibacillus]MCQ6267727.1 universal stress protein [Fictibacillus sp. WQ 8-8]UZJ77932.1 universal stress protein [Fictibacillus sp. KU28468]
MYNKILIAFDGSAPSARALQHGVELAHKMNTEMVTILHVNKNLPLQEPLLNFDLDEIMEEEDKELLQPAIQYLSESGIPYETHAYNGEPSQIITSYAKKHEYDVIVMGSTGKGFIKEALLGSVSHQVAHAAECPVIIVK